MHEMSLANDILAIADEAAEGAGAKHVLRVRVGVGWLLQVEEQSLAFYLEAMRRDYPRLAGSAFDLETEPVRVRCQACGSETVQEDWCFLCSACRSTDVRVVAGDRLEVRDMEVLTADV